MQKDDVVEVQIKKREIHFVVWLVPLIALLIGGWMIYKYYDQLGPMIAITFKNSGGLEPKQSIVKFRDVKVGTVERIAILKKREGVMVYVRMNKDVVPFLNKHAKFWIVKPEIGLGKVRGLDALMSGAYIQMESRLGGESKYRFKGLEEAPLTIGEEKGSTFTLRARSSYALQEGLPVYYKDIRVGSIKKVELTKNGREVEFFVFVRSPYDKLVNDSTRFYNIKAVDVSMEDGVLHLRGGSLSQLLLGGVAFVTPQPNASRAKNILYLYPSYADAMQKRLGKKPPHFVQFVMHFHDIDGGLRVGTGVYYKGFKIGEVQDVRAHIDPITRKVAATVRADIDSNAFAGKQAGIEVLRRLTVRGLAAHIESANFLTDARRIVLDFTHKGYHLQRSPEGYELATTASKGEALMAKIDAILAKLEKLPLQKAVNSFTQTMQSARKPLVGLLQELRRTSHQARVLLEQNATKEMPAQLNTTLTKLQQTIQTLQKATKAYGDKSLFHEQLKETLRDIDRASKSLNKVLVKIYKKPNAIIFGD